VKVRHTNRVSHTRNCSIATIFKETYNNQTNFMTQDIVGYGTRGNYIYELSQGEFMGDKIYGVTVLTKDGQKTKLNKCCHSQREVSEHLASLETASEQN
jgi:hypothetical protein